MASEPNIPDFISLVDNLGQEYFSFNFDTLKKTLRPKNDTEIAVDMCTFLSESIKIKRRATGTFSTDLTSRDDLILAILSLLLLLVIEGTLTTILLRSRRGRISTFGFSIKQFIELAREFKFRYLLRGRRKIDTRRVNKRGSLGANTEYRKINPKLLVLACGVLTLTFGLEVVVLYLTSPRFEDVFNTDTAFQLIDSNPDWNEVRNNTRAATIRPCTAITLAGVEQGRTQISACLTSQGLSDSVEEFQKVTKTVEVTITTVVHEYGVEHNVQIGDISANYSARAYFVLAERINTNEGNAEQGEESTDEATSRKEKAKDSPKPRLMRRRVKFFNKEVLIGVMHKQLIAFLFTAYARETKDASLGIEALRDLNFARLKSENGPDVNIIQIQNSDRYRQVTSVKHTTKVEGRIPAGAPALQFALAVFKGSIAISLGGPDRYDLIMGSSNTFGKPALMWRETSRPLNWLSLIILFVCAFVVFAVLRYMFKPISTAEIAGAFVIGAVGADSARPPVLLADDEENNFSITFMSSNAGYRHDRGFSSSLDRTDRTEVPQESAHVISLPG